MLYQIEYNPQVNKHFCLQVWPWQDKNDVTNAETYRVLKIFHITIFVVLYAWPLTITIVIYFLICRKLWLRKIPGNVTTTNRAAAEKSKRKVVRLLVVIVLVFAICWFPNYVDHYIWFVRPDLKNSMPCEAHQGFLWLAHANKKTHHYNNLPSSLTNQVLTFFCRFREKWSHKEYFRTGAAQRSCDGFYITTNFLASETSLFRPRVGATLVDSGKNARSALKYVFFAESEKSPSPNQFEEDDRRANRNRFYTVAYSLSELQKRGNIKPSLSWMSIKRAHMYSQSPLS